MSSVAALRWWKGASVARRSAASCGAKMLSISFPRARSTIKPPDSTGPRTSATALIPTVSPGACTPNRGTALATSSASNATWRRPFAAGKFTPGVRDRIARNALSVAATRATEYLNIFVLEDADSPAITDLVSAAQAEDPGASAPGVQAGG